MELNGGTLVIDRRSRGLSMSRAERDAVGSSTDGRTYRTLWTVANSLHGILRAVG